MESDTLIIQGRVITGLGKGRMFLSKRGYRQQLMDKLGIDPVEGTLNLYTTETKKLQILNGSEGIHIEGFVEDGTDYGSVKVFPAEIQELKATVIFPARTTHKNIIEVVSEHHLREELDIKDEDMLSVKVFLS